MVLLRKAVAMAALIAAFSLPAEAQSTVPVVKLDSGQIAGVEKDGMVHFLGIPYAAPPVGDLRWQAPQAVKPWAGVRQVTQFGPACRQTADWVKEPQSEDCLTLNVYAPAKKSDHPYPVMVWIHGGGLTSGHGSEWGPEGGRSIVQKGMVLVMINYRLGVFGFFPHPELSAEAPDHGSGNQGFRDQIAALQWVKRNIAAFGGDPNLVTITGCSAGGSSVAALTVSPLAKGLFQRGISESGVTGPMPAQVEAEKRGSDLGLTLKAPHLADLRKISAEELLKQNWRTTPNLDGVTFTEPPQQSFAAGHQNKVPVLLGWNADEGVDLAADFFGTNTFTAANYEGLLQKIFGPQVPPFVLAQYPGKSDEQAKASAQHLITDMIGFQHFAWATMRANAKSDPTYLYYYVHTPAEASKEMPCNYGCNAGHSAEIRFAYDLLWQDPRTWNAEDRKLRDSMLGYWTNFAKTGDPNGEGLPKWPVFDGSPAGVQVLGSEAEIKERGTFPDFRLYLAMSPN